MRSPKNTWDYIADYQVITQAGSYGIKASLLKPFDSKGKRVFRRVCVSTTFCPGRFDSEKDAADYFFSIYRG